MKNVKYIFALVFLSILGVGCGDDGSEPRVASELLSTGQITANFQVTEDGSGSVEAIAQLSRFNSESGEDEVIFLVGADVLWLYAGTSIDHVTLSDDVFENIDRLIDTQIRFQAGRQRRSTSSFLFGFQIVEEDTDWYSAILPVHPFSEYQVGLLRKEGIDAESSTVILPDAFEVSFSTDNTSVSRSMDSLTLEWNNTQPNASVIVYAELTCPGNFQFNYSSPVLPDTGIFSFNPGDLVFDDAIGDCATVFTVRKTVVGDLDLAFGGGRIDGHQVRRLSIRTVD